MPCRMSQVEMEDRIAQVRTGLAFGGYALSDESRRNLEDILSGRRTEEDVVGAILQKYVRPK